MEQRWSKRYPAEVDVTLYQYGLAVACCTARDVGIEGMFVAAGPLRYGTNTQLDVEFEVQWNRRFNRNKRFRLPVIVVHNAKGGLGLMIMKAETEARYAWQQMMTRAREQVKAAG